MTPAEFQRLPVDVQRAWEMVWLWKLRPGDEHPTRKGWVLQNELGEGLEPLWFKPPHPVWKVVRPVLFALWIGAILVGIVATVLFG
jgi:hypothetical protein